MRSYWCFLSILLVFVLSTTVFATSRPRFTLKKSRLLKAKATVKPKSRVLFPCDLKVSSVFSQPSGEFERYVKSTARTLDWNKKDLRCFFLWDSKAGKSVKSYICQVSLFPFSKTEKDWRKPVGLVYKKRFLGKSHVFSIDFRKFAPSPMALTRHFLNRNNLIRIDKALRSAEKKTISLPNRGKKQKSTAKALRKKAADAIRVNKRQPFVAKRGLRLKSSSPLAKLKTRGPPLKGASVLPLSRRNYYVRLILLSGSGKNISAPSNTIVIDYGEPKAGKPVEFFGVNAGRLQVPVNNPAMYVKEYNPIRQEMYDAQYRFVVWKEPSGFFKNMYKVGQKLYLNPYKQSSKKSFWDKVGDAISAAISFIKNAVNWASKAYASIKSGVARFIAARVPGVDAAFVEGLIDAGLASMGIPPSLPNFDQLTSMGKDYLAQTIVDQVPVPIPPQVARKAMDKLLEDSKRASGGGGALDFIRLDPDVQRREAHLILRLHNPTKENTMPGSFYLRDDSRIFESLHVSFPSLRPGQGIDLPIFLTPNNDYWNLSKHGRLSDEEWYRRYKNWPTRIRLNHAFAITPQYIARVLGVPYDKQPFDMVFKNKSTAHFQHDADSAYKR